MKLVGVTGTKGKTTITYILESILRQAGFEVGVIGTISHRGPGFAVMSSRTTPESVDLQRILKDMADRDQRWQVFRDDPGWKKLSANPAYRDTVSNITDVILRPTEYSQI